MTKGATGTAEAVRVWDLPTRLFHWLLAASVATAWVSGEKGWFDIHFFAGYAILGLLAFRLVWGFAGSRTARFSDFVKGPGAIAAYLRARMGRGAKPVVIGHNPLGGWMVVVLLLILSSQAGSGLFTSDDILVDGPLVSHASSSTVSLLSTVHRLGSKLILLLVALHIAAILVYRLVLREDLVRPMITGVKLIPHGER